MTFFSKSGQIAHLSYYNYWYDVTVQYLTAQHTVQYFSAGCAAAKKLSRCAPSEQLRYDYGKAR